MQETARELTERKMFELVQCMLIISLIICFLSLIAAKSCEKGKKDFENMLGDEEKAPIKLNFLKETKHMLVYLICSLNTCENYSDLVL